jgi:hypothetical protein
MAKGDKQDVAKAKSAAAKNRKGLQVERYEYITKGTKKVPSPKAARAYTKDYDVKINKMTKNAKKIVEAKYKPSVATKTGAKNKVKAQGAKMSKGGLNYSGRKGK